MQGFETRFFLLFTRLLLILAFKMPCHVRGTEKYVRLEHNGQTCPFSECLHRQQKAAQWNAKNVLCV